MPPSSIDKIICSIAVFKCELIDRLRTIVKRSDQWMPKVIPKRTSRVISNPFAAEVIASISSKPAIDVVKHVNDQNAAIVARAPATSWGLGTLNPLEASHISEGERCLGSLGFKGLLITSSWHGQFLDTDAAFPDTVIDDTDGEDDTHGEDDAHGEDKPQGPPTHTPDPS